MEVKKICTEKLIDIQEWLRPVDFSHFVGQESVKKVLSTAIASAVKRNDSMGHVLLSWPSGFGKTTMANIIAKQMGVNIKAVAGYALNKPAEMISLLNTLEKWDILFIDEIHRIKPNIEEVLYLAMEDNIIDMVMPDGGSVRIPLEPFTLVGATTKSESLSEPFKNRFVYSFHFMEYTLSEKKQIIQTYLKKYGIVCDEGVLDLLEKSVVSTPREIHNFVLKLRDYLIVHHEELLLSLAILERFLSDNKIQEGWLTPLHNKYLEILAEADRPLGVKTLAIQLGIHEKSVEEDVEPLLLKLGKIDKTRQGRILI